MRFNLLKFLAFFATLSLIVSLGFSQKAAVGPMLYDQISKPYPEWPNSIYSFQATDDANSTKTTFSADDFTVPTGETWKIDHIEVLGIVDEIATNPDVDSVNVMIYEMSDTADIPAATEAYTASRVTDITYNGNGDFIINLPTPATLAEGSYWLSVQPAKNLAEDGYWQWEGQSTGSNGFPFHYKNPGLGYFYNAPDWTSGQTLVSWWASFDLSFALYGPRKDHDLAIKAASSPVSGPSLGMEDVIITVENRGLVDQSNVDVRYQVDANGWVTENIPVTIAAGDTHTFTFSAQADLSAVTDYSITAEVQLAGDEHTGNDSQTWNVTNFGEYYLFTQFDSISTCSGGFADPGGPAGSYTAPVADTCTIYPVGENTRTRLIFHEFDNGWGQFYIYDGTSPDAPVIDLTPNNPNTVYAYDVNIMDTVTAKNSTGALTIVFSANSGTIPGWDASIECFTPPADDFEMVSMWTSIPTIFEGQDVDIETVVYNAGLTEQSKDVTFYINNVEHGTVTSNVIGLNEYDTVSIVWTPTAGGVYDLKASVTADDGIPANDTISIVRSVYADGDLVESFEGDDWLPEFWSSITSSWYRNSSAIDLNQEGDYYATAKGQDTLITPRLIIEDGDILELKAFSQMWWYTTLDLYYSENPTGPWTLIANIPVSPMENVFQDFSIDISDAAGNNHLAFATGVPGFSGLDMNIDFVRGPQIFYYDNNITAKNISADVSPMQYDTLPYEITIKNTGLNDLDADSYTVKLMMDEGAYGQTELASISGDALASKTAMTYTLEYALQDIGYANIYGYVDFADDQDLEDNTTRTINVFAQAAGTDTVEVGNATAYQTYYPFNGAMNTEVRQTMYYADEVGAPGTINGLTYFYQNNSTADYTDIPIQIWVAEVDTLDTDMSAGLRSSDSFTMVYNDSINFEALSEGEFYFPFEETAFTYTGGNLIVMFYRIDDGTYYPLNWLGEDATTPNRSAGIQFVYGEIDHSDTAVMNSHYSLATSATLPNTVFHKNESGIGQVEGYAYNENSDPLEGVNVSLPGTSATTTTDEFGFYELLVAPEGDIPVKAVKFGYNDVNDTVTVLAGDVTQFDFNMALKPEAAVTGRVIRSDDATGIADLPVNISGYTDYQVVTDADGYFVFDSVYANETYEINLELEFFEAYTAEFDVTDTADVDLGDLVMQEVFEPAYYVNTSEVAEGIEVSWNKPYSGTNDSISLHWEEGFWSGYTADIDENVWMGNLFDVTENGTITGFNIIVYNYDGYDYTEGEVSMEIFDMNENLVASVPFTLPVYDDQDFYTIHVDVPDVTFNGSFYAMIHWQGLDFYTPLIAYETGYNETAPNLARFKYEGENFQMFSDIGTEGIFEIGAEVVLSNGKETTLKAAKAHEGYNIYRGLTSDLANAESWDQLNADLITSTEELVSYLDETWPPAEEDFYSYAIEAAYTESSSVLSFSEPVSHGVYSNLNFAITTNSGASANGALVTLENHNGSALNTYDAIVDADGLATVEGVKDGTYTISVQKPGFVTHTDDNLIIDNHTETIAIELEENLAAPSEIGVTVHNDNHTAELNWSMTTMVEYILDDDSFENGLSLNPNSDGYLGNLFNVSDQGTILEFCLYGQQNTSLSGEQVTIEVFDSEGISLGATSPFNIPADEWITVSVDSIDYSGSFYAMVHWNNLTGNTNFLAVDTDGPNVSQGYYYDESNGFLPISDLGTEPGVFFLRATALASTGKEPVTIYPGMIDVADIAGIDIQESTIRGEAGTESLVAQKSFGKTLMSYNVFLNDMVDPMVTNHSETTYVFTEADLETNGTHTAGVSAVYTTGESAIINTDFNISFVSIEDERFKSEIYAYPNPSRSEIFIQNAEGAHITMYDLKGTNVIEIKNLNQKSIDISALQSGLYIIRVIDNGNVFKSKIEVID